MKKALSYILLGFFLGVAVAVVGLHQYMWRIMLGEDAVTDQPRSVELAVDGMLHIQDNDGVALIDFLSFGSDGAESPYRWRYKPQDGTEISGDGVVYEKYDRIPTTPGHFALNDQGSRLEVVAGRFTLKWSYGSTDRGWIYVSNTNAMTKVIPDDEFDVYDLSGF